MDLSDIMAMNPIGQIKDNISNPTALHDSAELLCTLMMAVPEFAMGLDPISTTQILQEAMGLHKTDGDVQLICIRAIGAIVEFVPKACQRICDSQPLPKVFLEQLRTAHPSDVAALSFRKYQYDEWIEETLRLLQRLILEGQRALGHISGGLNTVCNVVVAVLDKTSSTHVQSAVLRVLADLSYRMQTLSPDVIHRLALMLSATVSAMRSQGDPTAHYATLRTVCDCLLSHLRPSDSETLTVSDAHCLVEAIFLGVELFAGLTASTDAKSHMELLLLVLAMYAHASPTHNVPFLQRILSSNTFSSQGVLLHAFDLAGVAGIDFARALANPYAFLPQRGEDPHGQVVAQESFHPAGALSSLLYLFSALVDHNSKAASTCHYMVPRCSWFWEDDGNNFNKYDEATNKALENMYRRMMNTGGKATPVKCLGRYEADIVQMKQKGGGAERNIRRSSIPFTFTRDTDTPVRLLKGVPYDKDVLATLRDTFLETLISVCESGDPLHSEWAMDLVDKTVMGSTWGMPADVLRSLCGFLSRRMPSNSEYVTRLVKRLAASTTNKVLYTTALTRAGLRTLEDSGTGRNVKDALGVQFKQWLITKPLDYHELALMCTDASFLTGSEVKRTNLCQILSESFDECPDNVKHFTEAMGRQEGAAGNFISAVREALSFVMDEIQSTDRITWTQHDSGAAMGKLLSVSLNVMLCEASTSDSTTAAAQKPPPKSKTTKKGAETAPATGPVPPPVGTVVEATWKGGKKFYKGKVTAVNPDNTVAIQFDDGDFEPRAALSTIKGGPPPSLPAKRELSCPRCQGPLAPFTSPTWSCDECGIHGDNHTSLACRSCDYDMCMSCVQARGGSMLHASVPGAARAHSLATVADATVPGQRVFIDTGSSSLEIPSTMTLMLALWLASPLPRPSPIAALRALLQLPPQEPTHKDTTAPPKKASGANKQPKESTTPPPTPVLQPSDTPCENIFAKPLTLHIVQPGERRCACGWAQVALPGGEDTTCPAAPMPLTAEVTAAQSVALESLRRVIMVLGEDAYSEPLSQRLLHQSLQRCVPIAIFGRHAMPRWFNIFPADIMQKILSAAQRRALLLYLSHGAYKMLIQSYLKSNAFARRSAGVHIAKRESKMVESPQGLSMNKTVKVYTISRQDLAMAGAEALRQHSGLAFSMEVHFQDEDGTGQGPTSEFFSIMSKEMLRGSRKLWRGWDRDPLDGEGFQIITNEGVFPNAEEEDYKARVTRMYSKYNKEKLREVPALLERFAGSEQALIDKLVEKYGPEPPLDEDKRSQFMLLGRLAGVAMVEGKVLEIALSPVLLDIVRGGSLTLKDVAKIDEEVHRSLSWVRNADAATLKDVGLNFTHSNRELCPGGTDIVVTVENASHYVDLVVREILYHSVEHQCKAFFQGLQEVMYLDPSVLRMLSGSEWGEMLCGTSTDLTQEEFATWLEPSGGYTHSSQEILFLIELWGTDFTPADRAEFLFFCTGVRKLGPGGIQRMRKLTVRPWSAIGTSAPGGALPTARACGFILNLPNYTTKELMAVKLKFALYNGKGFFLS